MLSKRLSKSIAITAVFTVLLTAASNFSAAAQNGVVSGAPNPSTSTASTIDGVPDLLNGSQGKVKVPTGAVSGSAVPVSASAGPVSIASVGCTTCGANLNAISLMATDSKKKSESVLTDSLWGNLILELAYQRDKELKTLSKRMNLVSLGTLGAIGAISAGTLAQGIDALIVLNPHDGHLDSYAPGIVGVTMSSITIMTFLTRFVFNHKFQKQVRERQIAIKTHVEAVLNHMEQCDAKCADAKRELTELVGPRACREWIQLYQSSHKLAMSSPREVSFMLNTGQVK